jgi:hypothetical protein
VKYENSEILRMVEALLAAPEDTLACDQVLAQLPAAVDAAIAGENINKRFPHLVAHLQLCDQCHQEFEDLLDITRMAEAGNLPEPDQFPQPSFQRVSQRAEEELPATDRRQFLMRFRQYLETLRADALEPGIEILRDMMRGGTSAFGLLVKPTPSALHPMPVRSSPPPPTRQFAYGVEPLGLQVTLKAREFERHRFTIRGLIEGDQAFEGLGVSLLSSEDNEPLDCTAVDDANTFSFHSVSPGRYSIRLDVTPEEGIYLTDVDI